MKLRLFILVAGILTRSVGFCADQSRVDYALGELSRENAELRRDAKEIPACVLMALRQWVQIPFVMIDWGQSFPPLRDIRHAGDGQFRLLFFSKLSPKTTLLCFQDNASIGRAYRAVFIFGRRGKCVVKGEFSLGRPVRSIEDVRAAIIENAKYQKEKKGSIPATKPHTNN